MLHILMCGFRAVCLTGELGSDVTNISAVFPREIRDLVRVLEGNLTLLDAKFVFLFAGVDVIAIDEVKSSPR